jgi:argininosuccinate lyase
MSEAQFKAMLNLVNIVQGRTTVGGPQASEMNRVLVIAKRNIDEQRQWISAKSAFIQNGLDPLDRDFAKLMQAP